MMNYTFQYSDRARDGDMVILALAAAILYGSADFLGGLAARRASPLAVTAVTAPAGMLVLLVVLAGCAVLTRTGHGDPTLLAFGGWGAAGWAIAGGVVGVSGLVVFFKGFASAPMSVVAPVAGLVSTVVPVAVAIAGGERPGASVVAGAALCLTAIVLVSAQPSSGSIRLLRGLGYGVAAGAAFGVFYLCLKTAGHAAVLWPAVIQRLTGTVVMLGAVAVARTGRGGLDRRLLLLAGASGAVDAAANVSYMFATRAGLFGLAVVISSLYPGATVLLARVVLRERMRTPQRIGLLLAAAGIVLVTA
jgi:drug/metabolite transporter (DMT)-like permease